VTPLRSSEPESPFEHPALEAMYTRVLRDVADRRLHERERKAAARTLAFLLRERIVDEAVATDVLTAIHRALDLSKVVRTLLLGLRDALGDHERVTEWTRAVADRSLREVHLASFVTAMRILVELRDYDGTVPTRWRLSLLRAVEVPELAPRVLRFARAYARLFPAESWRWIREARVRGMVASLRGRSMNTAMPEARES
jgi:hypothetical protein